MCAVNSSTPIADARRVVGHRPDARNQSGNEREPGVEDDAEQQGERTNRVEGVQRSVDVDMTAPYTKSVRRDRT